MIRKPKFDDLIKFKIIKEKGHILDCIINLSLKKTKRRGKNIIHQTCYIVNYNSNL